MTSRTQRFTAPLKQDAVYWGTPVDDGYGGKTFADPVEIKARWEQTQELFVDFSGREQRSSAVVFVDRDLDMGGYLFLGTLADLTSAEEADPQAVEITTGHDRAHEIRGWEKIPDRRAQRYERMVYL